MTSLKCEEKKGRVVSVIFSNSPYALIEHSGQRRIPQPMNDSVWKTVSCIWCDVKVHQPLHKQWLYRHMLQCHDRVHLPEQGNASSHVGEWLKSRSVRQRKYSHLNIKGRREYKFQFLKRGSPPFRQRRISSGIYMLNYTRNLIGSYSWSIRGQSIDDVTINHMLLLLFIVSVQQKITDDVKMW